MADQRLVDHCALKVNQTGIVATVLVAFLGSAVSGVVRAADPALALVLLLGTFAPSSRSSSRSISSC